MFPYKTTFILDRASTQPLYIQLSNQFIQLIKDQKLIAKTKLPGSRIMAKLLDVHRKTIVACYEELSIQGWVESIPKKGTFIHSELPELKRRDFKVEKKKVDQPFQQGFEYYKNLDLIPVTTHKKEGYITINDGVSDARLTPVNEIARTYRRIAGRSTIHQNLSYGTTYGNDKLRETLVNYLNETRGLRIKKENIMITRGSQNGIYLSAQLLLKEDDVIVVGETNYASADLTFKTTGAELHRISVDKCGLVIKELEDLCKLQQIKAVYVTSHHHHPTTVTLSAQRRIHLLNLAKQYHFAILEDDYDYDFNYNHAPILPLASHDTHGNVIYIGSVCKTVAPAFRVGYLIASADFIDEVSGLRRIVDRQGDELLELTFSDFIKSGELDAHIRKVMKLYKKRRDLFCGELKKRLHKYIDFTIPKGGMAVWVVLSKKYTWEQVAKEAEKQKLVFGNVTRYDLMRTNHNAIRIGFASYNESEILDLITKLEITMHQLEHLEKFD